MTSVPEWTALRVALLFWLLTCPLVAIIITAREGLAIAVFGTGVGAAIGHAGIGEIIYVDVEESDWACHGCASSLTLRASTTFVQPAF